MITNVLQQELGHQALIQLLWDEEYSVNKTLPSTLSNQISRCFNEIEDLLPELSGKLILDIGCGNGRHSIHFANQKSKVHAIDLSEYAVELAKLNIKGNNLTNEIQLDNICFFDFNSGNEQYDILLDSYMSCHLINDGERKGFFEKVSSLLKPGGLFISYGISRADSFYASFARNNALKPVSISDPITKIPKYLTTKLHLTNEVNDYLDVERIGVLPMKDTIIDKTYPKEAIYLVARK